MTAERWLPIPYDPTPYANAPGETAGGSIPPTSSTDEWTWAPAVSPSAPAPPTALPPGGPSPAGALLFHCANCKHDWDEPYCDWCGATLSIDRPSQQHLAGSLRGAEGDEV